MIMLPTRTPEALLAAIASLDVEHNERYLPRNGLTWCNRFVADVTELLGCAVPFILANEQHDWLGHSSWVRCEATEASRHAMRGLPAIASWKNIEPGRHGHIAMFSPTGELKIAQAGRENFENGPLRSGFGSLPVTGWVHF